MASMAIGSRPENGSSSTSRSWIVDQRGDQLNPLLIAVGERVQAVRDATALELTALERLRQGHVWLRYDV